LTTTIAFALCYDVTGLKNARGSSKIDTESYIAKKMTARVKDDYCSMFKDQDITHLLLDPNHTAIRNGANRSFLMTRAQPLPPLLYLCLSHVEHSGPSYPH
ncbi:hypothetical protein Ancab_004683, partial [Ancistrocladus abbreviatus]